MAAYDWNDLANARAQGYHIIGATADSNPCNYMPYGPDSFDTGMLEDYIWAQRDNILEYASDGTLMGLLELNEPQDPNCEEFGGDPSWKVPQSALYEVASWFWNAFPELSKDSFYFGFSTNPTYLEEGGGSPSINIAFLQYAKPFTPIEEWADPERASADRQGLKLIYSSNIDMLGLTAALAANTWECQQDDAVLVTIWRDLVVRDADGPLYEEVRQVCETGLP